MFYQVRSIVGPIDILVNMQASRATRVQAHDRAGLDGVINTNLNSVFNVTRQVIDGMSERAGGRIIKSRRSTHQGPVRADNYSAAKAGPWRVFEGPGAGSGAQGRHVNTVSPGTSNRHGEGDPAGDPRADHRLHPDGPVARPEEIAAVVAFPRLEEPATSRRKISVNGGMHMM